MQIADSLKKELKNTRGDKRIDCLNHLAGTYYWLWDEDDTYLDTACRYSEQAYDLARKSTHKRGLGYATLWKAWCLAGRVDGNSANNNSEANYVQTGELAQQAIQIGEAIRDYRLVGDVYYMLTWMERWKGDPKKFKFAAEKAVYYYEKPVPNKLTGVPNISTCVQCQGNEELLGDSYYALSVANWIDYNYEASQDASFKAISNYSKVGDEQDEIMVLNHISMVYFFGGDFEKGVENGKRNILLVEKLQRSLPANKGNRFHWGWAFLWMQAFYRIGGDYETALEIMHRSHDFYYQPLEGRSREIWSADIGELHRLKGNYDSAMYYLNPFTSDSVSWSPGKAFLAALYSDLKQYDKALLLINQAIDMEKGRNRVTVPLPKWLTIKANIHLARKEYNEALQYAREGFDALKIMKGKVPMIDNYKTLSDVFESLGNGDSAYFYLKRYTILKDSLYNRQLFFRLSNYKKEAEEQRKADQLNLLNKDNQLKAQKLKQEASVKKGLIAGLIMLGLLVIFIFRILTLKRKNALMRQQLENEKKQAELQQKATELEMQALRAQMNPHFIFNCLSSINKFILKSDTDAASDYLTRFSRLIRQVLTNSQLSLIPLSDEIEMLRLYLDMERLRFSDSFTYNITYENTIEPETVYIPPMLLQPFCENAIWHGLMHLPPTREGREAQGKLDIIMSLTDEGLQCIIADNGIGRAKAAELKTRTGTKQKSFGLKITTERLALFNDQKNTQSFCRTEDITDSQGNAAGTKVILNIKLKTVTHPLVKELI